MDTIQPITTRDLLAEGKLNGWMLLMNFLKILALLKSFYKLFNRFLSI